MAQATVLATSMSAGSEAGSPVPAGSSTSPRMLGRWSSPARSRPAACGSRPARGRCASRRRGAATSRGRLRAGDLQHERPPGRAMSALCHRTLRVPADTVRLGPGGGGAGHRSGAGHPGLDGFPPDRRRSQADGRTAVPRSGDGHRGQAARPPAGRALRLGPVRAILFIDFAGYGSSKWRRWRSCASRCAPWSSRSAARSPPSSIMTSAPSIPPSPRPGSTWRVTSSPASTTGPRATRPAPSCASSSATRCSA